MENQLQTIVKESGLEASKAQVILDKFQDYFAIAADWEKKAKTLIVTNESQQAEMQMARTGRLFLREKRIAIEKTRKELKEQALREGKAIDGIANVLKALIVPIEEYLDKQEHFVEIREEKKREALRLEAEKKEEEQRLENERLDRLEQARINQASPYRDFWSKDKEYDFRFMAEDDFKSIMARLKKQKATYDKEQEKIRKENERLAKEAEERERKAREEKEQHEKELAAERAKAEDEKRKQEERLRKQKELAEKKRKQAEEKAHKEQERIKREAEAKVEAERKEKECLEEMLKNQVECPFCHKKFQLKR